MENFEIAIFPPLRATLYRFWGKFENRPSLNRHSHPSNPDNRFIMEGKIRWTSNIIDEKIINLFNGIVVFSRENSWRTIKITACQLVMILIFQNPFFIFWIIFKNRVFARSLQRSSIDISQRDDRGGWKENICLWPARKHPGRTDSAFARQRRAFHRVYLPSIREYSSTIWFRNVYTVHGCIQSRARKCFVTIVAVNCTCQPDIIDPARREELRTWVEGTEWSIGHAW